MSSWSFWRSRRSPSAERAQKSNQAFHTCCGTGRFETWGKNRAVFYPLSTTGQGLCSNFCNGVSVGSLGQVCIASLNGISYSTTGGFRYLQGSDLKAKPKWEDMRKQPGFPKTDNCTAVCEDSQGRIWVGTANAGVQVFHKGQWKRYDRDTILGGSHVHALASTLTGHFLVNFLKIVSWQT